MLRLSHPNPNTNSHPDPNTDPNTESTPNPNHNTDPNTNSHPDPNTTQLADHRVFTIYRPSTTFTSDSGATDILVIQRDASILTDYTSFAQTSDRPGFSIANLSTIYPIATGRLHIPNTTISLTAYVFNNTDLSANLFGLAPLINFGYTAIYSSTGLSIYDPSVHTVIYGTK